MFGRCKHVYKEVERFCADPAYGAKLRGLSQTTLERLTLGVTTISEKCTECGKERLTEILGRPNRSSGVSVYLD